MNRAFLISAEGLSAGKKIFDFCEESAGFLCRITGNVAQFAGNTFNDFTKLIRVQINAKKIFDQAKRIRGEFCDQILVSGQFADEIGYNFLNIHMGASFGFSVPRYNTTDDCILIIMQGKTKNNIKMETDGKHDPGVEGVRGLR